MQRAHLHLGKTKLLYRNEFSVFVYNVIAESNYPYYSNNRFLMSIVILPVFIKKNYNERVHVG